MLTDVPFESEEDIKKRVAVYEARFINRYSEKDDGYRICIQKAARHNQVPVIDYDKRHLRRKGWRDRRQYHNRPRYHNDNQGLSFRKQDDYSYRRQEEGQSDYSYGSRNVSYQPSATPLDPPAPLDYPVEDQASQEEFPTDPQTPGGHDFQNAPDPYEEKNFPLADKDVHIGMDREYSVPEQQWPNVRTNIAADNDPEQQVTAPNSIPTIEDLLPAHQTRVTTDEDCKSILSNASITTADRRIDKGKKHRKKVHAGVQKQGGPRGMSDKTIPLPQVIPRHQIPTAQLLKLSPMSPLPDPSGHHTQHQSSPSGIHVMHGTPRNVSTAEMDTRTSKKKKKKKDKKVKKKDKDKDREKKKERMHNTVEKSDATGEESNGSIDVTTVEQSITEAAPPHGLNWTIVSPGLSQTSGSDELPAKHKMKKHKQLGRPTD